MILNVSSRTDIVAFYSEWFFNRLEEGFVDIRNPIYPKLVSRIYFKDVDAILFCTKNPLPIVDKLSKIKKTIIFQVTITPYKSDIGPNIPNKKDIIESVKKISKILGIDNLFIRYDPVFLSSRYDIDYHLKAFNKLCESLDGYVKKIIISFIDNYRNVQKNLPIIKCRPLQKIDYETIGKTFISISQKHGMSIQTCCESQNLGEYGFIKDSCVSKEYAYNLTGKTYKLWKARNKKTCECVEMVDIGAYNTCKHLCKYCYANYEETKVDANANQHDPHSSLLIGQISSEDVIKIRNN